MEIIGPLPMSSGDCEFFLTYIDMASRWPEAVPLRTATTQTITGLTSSFSRNGFPRVVVMDNGAQFMAKTFQRFCSRHEMKKHSQIGWLSACTTH